jgi:hypothetical protein
MSGCFDIPILISSSIGGRLPLKVAFISNNIRFWFFLLVEIFQGASGNKINSFYLNNSFKFTGLPKNI